MKYEFAEDVQEKAHEACRLLFPHIKIGYFKCLRSYGTSTRRTIARCHGLGKVFQKSMKIPAYYVLEFISERFDKLSEEEQLKTIIHELMHIPKAFGGGFKHHDYVTEENVELHFKTFVAKQEDLKKHEYKFKI